MIHMKNSCYGLRWRPEMKGRLIIIAALVIAGVCMPLLGGCANNAQTGAAIGGAGGVVIGAVAGGGGGAVVGGLIGAGGGYIIGNEMDK
jgi:hypothetical protein